MTRVDVIPTPRFGTLSSSEIIASDVYYYRRVDQPLGDRSLKEFKKIAGESSSRCPLFQGHVSLPSCKHISHSAVPRSTEHAASSSKRAPAPEPLPRLRHRHSAFSPFSPVLIRTSSLMPLTKIIPSPALPVCELLTIVSIARCASFSPTMTRMFIMGTNSGINSAP